MVLSDKNYYKNKEKRTEQKQGFASIPFVSQEIHAEGFCVYKYSTAKHQEQIEKQQTGKHLGHTFGK